MGGKTIFEATALSVQKAKAFFTNLALAGKQKIIAERILKEIADRLGFLENVGLGYLTLDRSANTLSGGESQTDPAGHSDRLQTDRVLYVLDGPSIGLARRTTAVSLDTLMESRIWAIPFWWWNMTRKPSARRTTSSTWGPGPASTAGRWFFPGSRNPSPRPPFPDRANLSGTKMIEAPNAA